MKRLVFMLPFIAVLSLIAAQCGAAQPETVTVVETVIVEKEVTVVETVEVEKEVIKEIEVVQTVEVIQEVEIEVPAEPQAEGPSGTLRVALTTSPNSLDLPVAAERQATTASQQLYNSLVWIDHDGSVVPDLAESWEVSEDGSEYTFHLREGVTFHNGEEFNADAVVFTWERGKNPENQWSDKFTLADSVEKIDDMTVKVVAAEGKPNPLLLREMNDQWGIVPPGYIEEVGEEGFAEHPVGTGPFQFVEWSKGDRIVMEANPNYWEEGLPKVQNLIFRPIPESSTRVAAIQTGEIDIVTRLSSEEAQSLLGLPDVKVVRYPVDRVYYIAFNNLTTGVGEPTEDPLVRQAMNYAVDVDAIIDALFDGFARPAAGYVTSGNWGYPEDIEPFGYDPDKARELLAEAGFPDGFEMEFACPAGAYTNFEQVCEAIQGFLGEVGIVTELELMESGAYWDLEANKELPPLFGDSWSSAVGEALPRLNGALRGPDASFSSWGDPEIYRRLDEIQSTVDDDARAELYGELQQYMQDDPPFIYLYEPVTFEAVNPKVQNHQPRPAENYYLKDVWVVEDQ